MVVQQITFKVVKTNFVVVTAIGLRLGNQFNLGHVAGGTFWG